MLDTEVASEEHSRFSATGGGKGAGSCGFGPATGGWRASEPVELGTFAEPAITLAQLADVAAGRRKLSLTCASVEAMERSRALLEKAVRERRIIYGVTTGFGPLAGRFISPEQSGQLQRNLVSHLATGVGSPFSQVQTRAIMTARAVNLAKGHSAIRPESVQLLIECINVGIVPIIPSIGTVGASGDLTPLAHMTLALFGEEDVFLEGEQMSAAEAFRKKGMKPLVPEHKEALALVNGTSAMTAIAALNGCDARNGVQVALELTVLYAELLRGRLEAYDLRFSAVRPHKGQQAATRELLRLCGDSGRLRPSEPAWLPEDAFHANGISAGNEVPQDPYTIRCAPQIAGAVLDVLNFHDEVVETELNSVTDNPIFFGDDILHGGNFFGQHVAFASDALLTAVITLAVHSERKIARMVDEKLNGGLPAFLQGDRTGLQSGFMGAQVTASALVAEMRSKAVPASIQSIPTNANNQDVVTMGTLAARKTSEMLDHLFDVLAIEALIMVQAFEILGGFSSEEFGKSSRGLAKYVRAESPFLSCDRPLFADIRRLSAKLRSRPLGPRTK
jgi:tyrosine ammonia-lyase